MATYLLINSLFIVVALLVLRRWVHKPGKATFFTLAILLALTLVFDNLIIAFDIVRYTPSHLLGLYIGLVPIEDFMYTILAVIMVPALWRMFGEADVQ